MEFEGLKNLIATVGFPIGVAIYMLWFVHGHVKHNTEMLSQLALAIERLTERLGAK